MSVILLCACVCGWVGDCLRVLQLQMSINRKYQTKTAGGNVVHVAAGCSGLMSSIVVGIMLFGFSLGPSPKAFLSSLIFLGL